MYNVDCFGNIKKFQIYVLSNLVDLAGPHICNINQYYKNVCHKKNTLKTANKNSKIHCNSYVSPRFMRKKTLSTFCLFYLPGKQQQVLRRHTVPK